MLKNQINEEATELYKQIETTESAILKAKELLADVQADHEHVSKELEEFMFEFTYDIAMNDPEMAKPVDPRTGRTNQGWTDILMERKLEEQDEYIELRAKLFSAQEELKKYQHEIDMLLEERRNIEYRIRLLDVMSRVVGDE